MVRHNTSQMLSMEATQAADLTKPPQPLHFGSIQFYGNMKCEN